MACSPKQLASSVLQHGFQYLAVCIASINHTMCCMCWCVCAWRIVQHGQVVVAKKAKLDTIAMNRWNHLVVRWVFVASDMHQLF